MEVEVWVWWVASCFAGGARRISGVRPRLAVRELRFADRFVARLAVGEHTGELGDFGYPAAVYFLLSFDSIHGYVL